MIQLADLSPLQREALLAAKTSGSGSLKRTCGGFQAEASGNPSSTVFTSRLVRAMYRSFLFVLDDESFPREAKLTTRGSALADLLQAQLSRQPKAGAA